MTSNASVINKTQLKRKNELLSFLTEAFDLPNKSKDLTKLAEELSIEIKNNRKE